MDADDSIAHLLVVGDVARTLRIPGEVSDTLDVVGDGRAARVTRTVMRSEVLRILLAGPVDVVITASDASFLARDEFLAAIAAKVLPVTVLMLTSEVDQWALSRLRSVSAQVEHIPPPVELEGLRERVRRALRPRRPTAMIAREPLPSLVRRIASERRSFTLHVNAGSEYGSLTFHNGVLIDAQNARRTGDQAALDILGWHPTSVVFDRVAELAPTTVCRELLALIDEAVGAAGATAQATGPPERAALPISVSEEILAPPTSTPRPAGGPTSEHTAARHASNSERDMANIHKTLEETMKIDGAIGAAIADWDSGLCLGTIGGGSRLNIEVAAAGNCQVVKAKMSTMSELGIKGAIQDILITLDDQIHLLRPLRRGENMFIYLAIDKAKGNLALARHRLTRLEAELDF